MRRFLLSFIINVGAVVATLELVPGIVFSGGIRDLLLIALIFGGINLLIKPLLSMFSLPIEIATVGILTVVINAVTLLVLTRTIKGFEILAFPFPGIAHGPFLIAPAMLPAWGTALLTALIIGMLISFLFWLTRK